MMDRLKLADLLRRQGVEPEEASVLANDQADLMEAAFQAKGLAGDQYVALDGRIDRLDAGLRQEMAVVEGRLTGEMTKLETRMVEKITDVETRLTEKITDVETRMVEKITDVETRLTEKITDVEVRLTGEMAKLEQRIDKRFERVEESIVAVRNDMQKGFQDMTWGFTRTLITALLASVGLTVALLRLLPPGPL